MNDSEEVHYGIESIRGPADWNWYLFTYRGILDLNSRLAREGITNKITTSCRFRPISSISSINIIEDLYVVGVGTDFDPSRVQRVTATVRFAPGG